MANSNVLITGSNRGLGRGMLTIFLARPNTTAIAAVRNPSHPSAQSLASLPKGEGSQLIVVKLDSADASSIFAAVTHLQAEHGINVLDLVIANAAISGAYPTVAAADPAVMLDMYRINTVGSVLVYQATRSLLHASTTARGGVFVAVSTAAAWQTRMTDVPVPNAAYGPSKTALNWLMQKAHIEEEKLVVFPIDPGFVQTDMGNDAASQFGMPDGLAPLTIEESVKGCVAIIDRATREEMGGKSMVWDGATSQW